mmetsp:Transcript_38231/g.80434  ORF Transcript_38231/g.80434 Transcript_38231/m.80434 type:complete len:460 (+) Transcript_38231:82-1461(+)
MLLCCCCCSKDVLDNFMLMRLFAFAAGRVTTSTIRRLVVFASVVVSLRFPTGYYDVAGSSTIILSSASKGGGAGDHHSNSNSAAKTRVLIARTVSSAEVDNVVEDVHHVYTYCDSNASHGNIKNATAVSKSRCDALRHTHEVDPYVHDSRSHPTYLLCDSNITANNNDVEVSFLLFARSADVAISIQHGINPTIATTNVEIIDVSIGGNTYKIWNWLHHLNETRLLLDRNNNFDYVWMMDGDMKLRTLNWISFWQTMHLLRPKIAIPSIIASRPPKRSWMGVSTHPILRHRNDVRILAAETAIIEVGTPILRASTWLGFRNLILEHHPKLVDAIRDGGEYWLDAAWCHFAKSNLTGMQPHPTVDVTNVVTTLDDTASRLPFAIDPADESSAYPYRDLSCVVLYQTPMVHGNMKTLERNEGWTRSMDRVADYVKDTFGLALEGTKAYGVLTTTSPSYVGA